MLANRLLNRQNLLVLDVSAEFVDSKTHSENAVARIEKAFGGNLGIEVFRDVAPNLLYGTVSGETRKAHKMIRVMNGHGEVTEIQKFPDTIIGRELTKKTEFVRYYFLNERDFRDADKAMRGR